MDRVFLNCCVAMPACDVCSVLYADPGVPGPMKLVFGRGQNGPFQFFLFLIILNS